MDVVSHWTWSSTLLQSTYEVWAYGISGSYWCAAALCSGLAVFSGCSEELESAVTMCRYAGGATVNVLLFGILAIQVQVRAAQNSQAHCR